MVHLIAAFYALIFSFCHAGCIHHTEAQLQPAPLVTYGIYAPAPAVFMRSDFAAGYAASYAGAACPSCVRTSVLFNAR